jgi:hypothetical protein
MLPPLARLLPIPQLFMAVAVAACLFMVVAMLGPTAGAVADVDHRRAASTESAPVVDGPVP